MGRGWQNTVNEVIKMVGCSRREWGRRCHYFLKTDFEVCFSASDRKYTLLRAHLATLIICLGQTMPFARS